ncbi:MAG: 23S rRNA (adenine(2503)-C(2))-methyltransferase RlmN [Oligoflexia bacterium]|nr:23S rRNA (adenine(2503)-C(2))-methyltransferase RlmN [Oligoflexia bacterium]
MTIELKSLNLNDLTGIVTGLGKPAYAAKNIYRWIYKRRMEDFANMTDIAKLLREHFQRNISNTNLKIIETQRAKDDCVKFLFELHDSNTVEAVLIPHEGRLTLCVSTQVGCKMDCQFCCTAKQGFTRNLEAYEIVEQVLKSNDYARDVLKYRTDDSEIRAVTNIVYMGMGEPLDNIDSVVKSIEILSEDFGPGFGMRKITVSTCGLIPKVEEFKKRCAAKLAVSLNAADEKTRSELMPINRAYPMMELLQTIKKLPLKKFEFVTIEYILFKGFNDRMEDAKNLAKLLKDLPIKLNLIPFNAHEYAPGFSAPDERTLHDFYGYLASKGVICNVRYSRGADIAAACGQLKSRHGKRDA